MSSEFVASNSGFSSWLFLSMKLCTSIYCGTIKIGNDVMLIMSLWQVDIEYVCLMDFMSVRMCNQSVFFGSVRSDKKCLGEMSEEKFESMNQITFCAISMSRMVYFINLWLWLCGSVESCVCMCVCISYFLFYHRTEKL